MIITKFRSWQKKYSNRIMYTGRRRAPFYELAAKYLPEDEAAVILDIGSGEGEFVEHLKLTGKYKNLFLLDSNSVTVQSLKNKYENLILYRVPQKLPFKDASVSYVHCSHLIEHLNSAELYEFLKEIDRVLGQNGIFVVSAPLLWSTFYSDLTHTRPYNPDVLIKYLSSGDKTPSFKIISANYSVLELAHRYTTLDNEEGLGSDLAILDFFIQLARLFLSGIGIKRYLKNGYTLVLRKDKL